MASVAPQAFPRGRWTFFRNPFSCAPKPKMAEGPVQGELSLDSVRPVRNDLSDSDFEITRRTRPKAATADLALAGAESIEAVETPPVETQLTEVEKP